MKHILLFEQHHQYRGETLSVYYPKLGVSTEDVFRLVDYQDSYCNLYPGYEDADSSWSDEYWANSKEGAYSEVNDILFHLENLPDIIPVYRTIHVNKLSDVRMDDLGECWSYEKRSALEFGSHLRATVLLSGTIASEYIDWWTTIQVHFQHSGHGSSDDENEVRVDYPEHIKDLTVEWIGKTPSL